MSNKNNTLPIGELLIKAGLISNEQLQSALKIQSQYTNMKLGEILSLQEAVGVKTIDFFVEQWQEMEQKGQQFPLGYYLKQAHLLNDKQIQTILDEQKINNLKFGDLAVQKGWMTRGTIDFFLDSLTVKAPPMMSLITLEKYNRESLHLDKKYANYSLILSRILAWSGGNTPLTKAICHSFMDADLNIPAGMEIKAVDKLIEGSLIRNWKTTKLGTYIRAIKQNLLNNQKCEPILLLSEYENILLSGTRDYLQIKEQDELLNLGLIVRDKDQLRISNLIFQQIFNQNWLIKAKKIVESSVLAKTNNIVQLERNSSIRKNSPRKTIVTYSSNQGNIDLQKNNNENHQKTEPLTKIISLFTLVGVILLIPLVIGINNYYLSKQNEVEPIQSSSLSPVSKIRQFCNQVNLNNASSALNLIFKLETSKQEILNSSSSSEIFPNNCEMVLNKLRVKAAPQLGKEGRVIEAIANLCQIPASAGNINEATVWIEHWYNSEAWSQETKSYLNLVNDCPASDSITENG